MQMAGIRLPISPVDPSPMIPHPTSSLPQLPKYSVALVFLSNSVHYSNLSHLFCSLLTKCKLPPLKCMEIERRHVAIKMQSIMSLYSLLRMSSTLRMNKVCNIILQLAYVSLLGTIEKTPHLRVNIPMCFWCLS